MKKLALIGYVVMINMVSCVGKPIDIPSRSTRIEEVSDETQIVVRDPAKKAPESSSSPQKAVEGTPIDPWNPYISAKDRQAFQRALQREAKNLRENAASSKNPEVDLLQADLHEASAKEHRVFGVLANAAESEYPLKFEESARLREALARHQATISEKSRALAAKHFEKGDDETGQAYDEMAVRYSRSADAQAEQARVYSQYAQQEESVFEAAAKHAKETSPKSRRPQSKQYREKTRAAFNGAKRSQKGFSPKSVASVSSQGSNASSGAHSFEQGEWIPLSKLPARKPISAASPRAAARPTQPNSGLSVSGSKIAPSLRSKK